jgi:hypothetical protein
VTPDLSSDCSGRYGLRRYNEAFSERNTNFWTIGPHVDWRVAQKIKLGLSYHYAGLRRGATNRSSKMIRPISITIFRDQWMWNSPSGFAPHRVSL